MQRSFNAFLSVVAAIVALALTACARANDSAKAIGQSRRDVLARLDAYSVSARAVDADASSAFFTAQGILFEPGIVPIVSRDSIRAFIKSFPGVIVDSAMARADTVEVFGETAIVWGTYYERLRFKGQPASAQYGRFVMQWRREADGAWRIHRYYRVPLPPNWQPTPTNP